MHIDDTCMLEVLNLLSRLGAFSPSIASTIRILLPGSWRVILPGRFPPAGNDRLRPRLSLLLDLPIGFFERIEFFVEFVQVPMVSWKTVFTR